METQIKKVDENSISLGKEIILGGGIVAIPTETVYGLAASAYDNNAVEKVFIAKGRPQDNPLIVHLSKVEDLYKATDCPTKIAEQLLRAFSPGPITVVLHKNSYICERVSAGLDTVGIRIPSHKDARAFIEACGIPLAAPSANTSKRPSPTNAGDVYNDMNGKIPLILDGGQCEIGIESTVVDCMGDTPIILRTGKITSEMIKEVCGSVSFATSNSVVRSPGMKYTHYAPKCKMYCRFMDILGLEEKIQQLSNMGEKVVLLGDSSCKKISCHHFIYLGDSVEQYMKEYFSALRDGERKGSVIVCYIPFSEKEGEGLYNRALKSCGGNTI